MPREPATVDAVRHAEIQSVLSTEMIRLSTSVPLFIQIGVAALLVLVQGGPEMREGRLLPLG